MKPAIVSIESLLRRINTAKRVLITTHARADGDALACVAGMQRVLRQRGSVANGYVHEPVAHRYELVTDIEPLMVWDAARAPSILADHDLLLVVDTCAAIQLGDVAEAIRGCQITRMAVDHHITRDDIVDEAIVDESAGACAQLVLRICEEAGWPVDSDTATLLFIGMATDTGWFRFSNADSAVFSDAARLARAGAKPHELYERLFLREILPRVRLMGEVMSSFELLADGRLAIVRVTREMLARCGATTQMTEDIINEPQRLGSVVACAMITEPDPGEPVRVSMRSKRDVDVAKLAATWGGGGHARAAGAKIKGDYEAAVKEVTDSMLKAMEE